MFNSVVYYMYTSPTVMLPLLVQSNTDIHWLAALNAVKLLHRPFDGMLNIKVRLAGENVENDYTLCAYARVYASLFNFIMPNCLI